MACRLHLEAVLSSHCDAESGHHPPSLNPNPRYSLRMSSEAQRLLDEIRQLPAAERDWLIESLMGDEGAMSDEAFAAWQEQVGERELDYDEWFRKGVESALADTSGNISHEEAMQQFHETIRRARKLKRSA